MYTQLYIGLCTGTGTRVPRYSFTAVCIATSPCNMFMRIQGAARERSRNATPLKLVRTRQNVPIGPFLEGALYGWWYGYAYISVSRALLHTSLQTLGKPYVAQTLGKPYVILLYRKTLCNPNIRGKPMWSYYIGKPYVEPVRMREVTRKKRLYMRIHTTNHRAHPLE